MSYSRPNSSKPQAVYDPSSKAPQQSPHLNKNGQPVGNGDPSTRDNSKRDKASLAAWSKSAIKVQNAGLIFLSHSDSSIELQPEDGPDGTIWKFGWMWDRMLSLPHFAQICNKSAGL